jgi:hypothetical protein
MSTVGELIHAGILPRRAARSNPVFCDIASGALSARGMHAAKGTLPAEWVGALRG